jgi:hypothetical protein
LAPEDCTPNFLVLVTQQAHELLQKWWERNPTLFNDDHGVGGIKRFMSSKTPIRAWYNAELGCTQGAFRVRGGRTYIPSHCDSKLGSKLTHNVVRAITSVIVVVDIQPGTELTIGQIADYATLIGLAQIRESAEPGSAPTILHLFANNGEPRPEGLSTWDEAFLKALYDTSSDATVQVAEIKVRLDADLVH